MITPRTTLAAVGLLLAAIPASAAEVEFEGFYRARARAYSSLSIDPDFAEAYEGLSSYVEHRLWLKPKFLLNDQVMVAAEIRGLDGVVWGNRPVSWFDPSSDSTVPLAFTEQLTAPVPESDADDALLDLTLWRVYGEIHAGDHRFRFGRLPLHWGLGIWQNDGLGLHGEYGDSADRVQWEGLFGNIYASLAVDVMAERFIATDDDTVAANAMAAWRTEQVVAGLNLQFRHTSNAEDPEASLDLFTASGAFDAELGQLEVHAEIVGRFGGGDLDTGANDVQIAAAGGALDAMLRTDLLDAGLTLAVASGDGDLGDNRIHTFLFDRDFNLGFILFEQPLPTLAAAIPTAENGGRDFDSALTGPALANAIVFVPKVGRALPGDLRVDVQAVIARTAKLPEGGAFEGRRFYGAEGGATLTYTGLDHVDLSGTLGVLVPGPHFTALEIDGTVFGGQLTARIEF